MPDWIFDNRVVNSRRVGYMVHWGDTGNSLPVAEGQEVFYPLVASQHWQQVASATPESPSFQRPLFPRRKSGSSKIDNLWIPAFAGMTARNPPVISYEQKNRNVIDEARAVQMRVAV